MKIDTHRHAPFNTHTPVQLEYSSVPYKVEALPFTKRTAVLTEWPTNPYRPTDHATGSREVALLQTKIRLSELLTGLSSCWKIKRKKNPDPLFLKKSCRRVSFTDFFSSLIHSATDIIKTALTQPAPCSSTYPHLLACRYRATCRRCCVVQQCSLEVSSEKIMKRIWGFDVRSETMAALMEKVQHTVRVSNVFHIPGLTADHRVIAIATHCYTLLSLFQSPWLSLVVCSA